MSEQPEAITIEVIAGALEQSYAQISSALANLSDPLSEVADEGGWTVRQLLSHLIGALHRVPIHTGYFLSGVESLPLVIGDEYWISEWSTAPVRSFSLALDAAYQGVKAILPTVAPDNLQRVCGTPFGNLSLDQFLLISVNGHIARFHGEQLAAFTKTP